MSLNTFRYLLDTNILSDLVHHPAGRVAQRVRQRGEDTVCTSIVAAAELRFGAAKKASSELAFRVNRLLDTVSILPLAPGADHSYADIRAFLERRGIPIGPNDLLIAAHALNQGLILVTHNVQEFSRVPELQVENWLS